MTFNQEIADELKTKPLRDQVTFILDILNNVDYPTGDTELEENRNLLLQFQDVLKAIKEANSTTDLSSGSNRDNVLIDTAVEILERYEDIKN